MDIAMCISWKFELRFRTMLLARYPDNRIPRKKLYYYQSSVRSDLLSLLVLLNEETQNPTGKLLRN